jgi:hypothetical protein
MGVEEEVNFYFKGAISFGNSGRKETRGVGMVAKGSTGISLRTITFLIYTISYH